MDLAYWHWLVVGMVLIVLEIFLPSFTALWFGLGALIVGALLWFTPGVPLVWQLMVWLLASTLFTWAWFRFFKRLSPDRTKAGLSREAILGETAQVISAPHEEKRGVLRFANGELDLLELRVGRDAGEQGAQLFKRVGLELGEMRIHVGRRMGVKMGIIAEKYGTAL